MVSEEQDGGFPGTCDQAVIGDKILDSGEAVDIMDCVEQHEAKNLANARHGLPQIEGVRVMVFGSVDDGTFDVAKQLVIVTNGVSFLLRNACGSGDATVPHENLGKMREVLAQTFDALPIREGDNPLANRVFIELRCAIEDLDGAGAPTPPDHGEAETRPERSLVCL